MDHVDDERWSSDHLLFFGAVDFRVKKGHKGRKGHKGHSVETLGDHLPESSFISRPSPFKKVALLALPAIVFAAA